MTTKEFTGDVDLQAQLERFYQDGQLAQAAVVAWMLSALKPDSPDWKIYRKKLLRETGAEGASVTEIVGASDQAFDSQQPSDGFAALALGLLARPENSPLLKKMLDRARAFEQRNFITAALIQLKEEQTDPEVLNVLGAMAQEAERYEEAERFFSQLSRLLPKSLDARLNLSAALTGLQRYVDAINELEWVVDKSRNDGEQQKEALFRLIPLYRLDGRSVYAELERIDRKYFASPAVASEARVKALIQTAMNQPEEAISAYENSLAIEENPSVRVDLSLIQLRLGDYAEGFKNYRSRFHTNEHFDWLNPGGKRWQGENIIGRSLLIWAEQGVGDEIFFGFMLDPVKALCRDVKLAVDQRLVSSFQASFPDWHVLSRDQSVFEVQTNSLQCDYEIPMGELMSLFAEKQIASNTDPMPLFKSPPDRLEEVRAILGLRVRPAIAVSWSGGTEIDGKARSMTLPELIDGLPLNADVDVISVQYTGDADLEVQELGDPRIRVSGLHNRNDLEGVLALLSQVDSVITVDNSVAHLAEAVGTPSYVVVPEALTQFRWKNDAFKRRYFPNATLLTRSEEVSWSEVASQAWSLVLAK